jgi:hypothetical protein
MFTWKTGLFHSVGSTLANREQDGRFDQWIPSPRILDRINRKVTIQNNNGVKLCPGGFK